MISTCQQLTVDGAVSVQGLFRLEKTGKKMLMQKTVILPAFHLFPKLLVVEEEFVEGGGGLWWEEFVEGGVCGGRLWRRNLWRKRLWREETVDGGVCEGGGCGGRRLRPQ